jgi:hypothetical protein
LGVRSQILAYISKIYIPNIILALINLDPNLLVLLVAKESYTFKLINLYNENNQIEGISTKTIERTLLPRTISANSIILSDFNLYYP